MERHHAIHLWPEVAHADRQRLTHEQRSHKVGGEVEYALHASNAYVAEQTSYVLITGHVAAWRDDLSTAGAKQLQVALTSSLHVATA